MKNGQSCIHDLKGLTSEVIVNTLEIYRLYCFHDLYPHFDTGNIYKQAPMTSPSDTALPFDGPPSPTPAQHAVPAPADLEAFKQSSRLALGPAQAPPERSPEGNTVDEENLVWDPEPNAFINASWIEDLGAPI
jgi:hypothetical protein